MGRRNTNIGEFNKLWQRHERLYHRIFIEALKKLKTTVEQRKNENTISEALCPILTRVCFTHPNKPPIPKWEMTKAPVSNAEIKGRMTHTRPDFTCSIVNTYAANEENHEISLHIECKRLGIKVGSWNLNKNYVENGIKRFDCHTHEYGKRVPSGFMIGYITNSKRSVILKDVKKHMDALIISDLDFKFFHKVETCNTNFVRKEVEPNEFKLIHLWADLRA